MSLLRRVLAGLATGAGNYLVDKAEFDRKAALTEVMANREAALEQTKFERQKELLQIGSQLRVQESAATTKQAMVRDTHQAAVQGVVQEKTDKRRQGYEQDNLRLRSDLGRQDDAASRKLQAQIDRQTKSGELQDTIQDEGGAWIGVYKNGDRKPLGFRSNLPESADGVVTTGGDEGGIPRVGGAQPTGGRGGGGQAAPAQPANLRALYDSATPETMPGMFQGKQKLPFEQVVQKYRGQ